jgi:hypothetical protein
MRGHGLNSSGLGRGEVAKSYAYGNEISGSIKKGEILDYPRNYEFLKKVFSIMFPKIGYTYF